MRFRPMHAEFGAEVLDFDVQHGGSAREIEDLRRAYDEYQLLLFRGGGRIAPERQVEITGWFGPPAPVANDEQGSLVSVLDNDDAAGSLKLPFHSDLTYTDVPIKGICLHAIVLPTRPTSTTYISGVAAWRKLPDKRKQELAGFTARHYYDSRMPGFDWPSFVATHPVRLIHPRTGQPVLFVTEHHADRIFELDEKVGGELLNELFTQLYAPEMQYEHVWQLNDLVVWDNLAVQHARTEHSDPGEGKRALQRVALSELGFHKLVERAREQGGGKCSA